MKELKLQTEKTLTGEVLKATQAVGVDVDKDELLKALNYDREQYRKGLKDGYERRDSEIVRCKDCKNWQSDIGWCDEHSSFIDEKGIKCHPCESDNWRMFNEDDYCSCGEKKER